MDHSEQPRERSRNARAQARHRAKRKAYVEQLEQTVTALQLRLGIPMDDLSVLPPASSRIRDLEDENNRLRIENSQLRKQKEDLMRMAGIQAHQQPQPEYRHNPSPGFHSQQDQHRRLRSVNEELSYPYSSDPDTYPNQRPSLPQPSQYTSLSPMSNTASTSSSAFVLSQLQIPDTQDAGNGSEPISPTFSSSNSQYSRSSTSYSPTSANATYSQIKVEQAPYQVSPSNHLSSSSVSYADLLPSMAPTICSPNLSNNGRWHHGYTSEQQYHH